jgi:hypothetical protein
VAQRLRGPDVPYETTGSGYGRFFFDLSRPKTGPSSGTIVVQNHYYPKPGLEQEVLRTRLEASAVRRELGLEVDRVLLRTGDVDRQPYVVWECDYWPMRTSAMGRMPKFRPRP